MIFQMMFAVITPALITGAFAERMKFSTFVVFILVWATLVYDPIAHWVWGKGGWLRNLGALDFAGGTVVHIASGSLRAGGGAGHRAGARASATSRSAPQPDADPPGRGLLWFGWFGFNAGSALAANGLAAHAFITTNTATAAAALGVDVHRVDLTRQADRARRGHGRGGRAGGDHAGGGLRLARWRPS